jgi:hypothetical protein
MDHRAAHRRIRRLALSGKNESGEYFLRRTPGAITVNEATGVSESRAFLQYVRRSLPFRSVLMLAVIGVVPAGFAVAEGARAHRRKLDFYPVRSEVLAKNWRGGRSPSYFLLIRYLDRAGGQHQEMVWASRGEYLASQRGDEVAAYVSAIDPNDAWLVSQGMPGYGRTIALAGFAAAMLLPLVIVSDRLRRRVAVLRDGQPVKGRVEKIGRDYRIRLATNYLYQLTWSCTGPDGRQRKGRSLHMTKRQASAWQRGDEIDVYFNSRHPWFAEVDVYGLREESRP